MAIAGQEKRLNGAEPSVAPARLRAIFDGGLPSTDSSGRLVPAVELSTPQSFVHCLLFVLEYAASGAPRMEQHRRHLELFFSRAGGLHLLLMLLNAYYNKPVAGRRPGWAFRALRNRIQISERALRMLIKDATAERLIIHEPGKKDRRCRTYRLTPPVIEAWEALTATLRNSLVEVFDQFDAGALANVDYRKWRAGEPAQDQIDLISPSRRAD